MEVIAINEFDKMINEMSLDDLCGQILCYSMPMKKTDEEIEEVFKKTKPGGLFFYNTTSEEIEKYTRIANKYNKVPIIVSTDAENGPGGGVLRGNHTALPMPMAWGACDDAELLEKAGAVTAQICRKNGFHWTYSPVTDINYNPNNPVTNIRAISDSPEHIVKIAGAFIKGLQKEKYMLATCKHFPGDGMDDKNQHFCTSVNTMSREEWMKTFGYVYKEMFKLQPAAVMVGHISLPAFQETECDEVIGYKPATLSYELMTKLLREKLGFEGCIVSDAMSMIGIAAVVPEERIVSDFLNAGGDMALFVLPQDFDYVKRAVEDGLLPIERLKDAVRRILKMKKNVGLLEKSPIDVQVTEDIEDIATKIAEKCVNIVRNADNILPVSIEKGGNVLLCNITERENDPDVVPFDTLEKEFNLRGIGVTVLNNPTHRDIEKVINEKNLDCIFVNCRISSNECNCGSLRLTFRHVMTFWRGLIFRHPKVVFTSFGDPYKICEVPFMRTYLNAFSSTIEVQKAFVKVALGEIEAKGKSPVEFKGYFEREV